MLTRAGLGRKETDEIMGLLSRIPRLRMRWFLYVAAAAVSSEETAAAATAADGDAAAAEDEEGGEDVFTRVETQVIRGPDGQCSSSCCCCCCC